MSKETSMKFKILNMQVGETLDWQVKIKAIAGLSEAKSSYSVEVTADDEYYAEHKKELEYQIQKATEQPDMFDDWKTTVRSLKDNIAGLLDEKKKMIELEVNAFNSPILQADF